LISGVPPEVFFLIREWTAQMAGLLPVEWALRGFVLLSDWSPCGENIDYKTSMITDQDPVRGLLLPPWWSSKGERPLLIACRHPEMYSAVKQLSASIPASCTLASPACARIPATTTSIPRSCDYVSLPQASSRLRVLGWCRMGD